MPRTETHTITYYQYDELSPEAQERARAWFREGLEYPWDTDNVATLTRFCEIFPVEARRWSYGDRADISPSPRVDDDADALRGNRLRTYILNNYKEGFALSRVFHHPESYSKERTSRVLFRTAEDCLLTGYCIDFDIMRPLLDSIKSPNATSSLSDLLHNCLWEWVRACQRDYEWYFSDEQVVESILANGYEFNAEGKRI